MYDNQSLYYYQTDSLCYQLHRMLSLLHLILAQVPQNLLIVTCFWKNVLQCSTFFQKQIAINKFWGTCDTSTSSELMSGAKSLEWINEWCQITKVGAPETNQPTNQPLPDMPDMLNGFNFGTPSVKF